MTDTLDTIKKTKIIAIARGIYGDELVCAAKALYEGGVRAFEVTFEQDRLAAGQCGFSARPNDPFELTTGGIARLCGELPADAAVGAGTVMDAVQVRAACSAGAKFVISPNVSAEVISETKRNSMVSIPGALTPTEIARAYELGADIVKVFPAGVLGVEYFKAVRAPLKHIPLAAVAGITADNIRLFADAGACAFGISSTLFNKELVKKGDLGAIAAAAAALFSALAD